MDALAMGAGALKFVSTFSQHKWKSAYSNYEAKLLEENAKLVAAETAEEEARFRRGFAKFQGTTQVARAKSGVDESGSFSWVQDANVQAGELDAMTIKYNGLVKQIGILQAATMKKAEATMYRRQALFNSTVDAIGMAVSTQSLLNSTGTTGRGLLTSSSYSSAPQPGQWNYTI